MPLDWLPISLACLLPCALGLLLYWELIIAEGAHLGPRVVIPLYDWVAGRYDRQIKKFDPETEALILGQPLAIELADIPAPRVLDIAAGTGRLARAALGQLAFDGRVVNLELAAGMLAAGRAAAGGAAERVTWVRAAASPLPFPDAAFDCVTCLEALEFLPEARAVLREAARVLKPGGRLVITNRVGWQAPLILGRTFSRAGFKRWLAGLGWELQRVEAWVVDYDLAWARKPAAEG